MKAYLEKAILLSEYNNLQPGTFEFRPGLNIIVGENGSGKSSLLKLISQQTGVKVELVLSKETLERGVETKFFDFEKDNPRTKDPQLQNDYGYAISSHFQSHGEAVMPLIRALETMKRTVIFVDEPESGVSISNQVKLLNILKTAEKNDCQIFVATHSYVIMSKVDEVFSMDELSWVKADSYVEKILYSNNENSNTEHN